MRTSLLFVAAAIIGLTAAPDAKAQSAWCAVYKGGSGTSCGFRTFEQCLASVSGVGGTCNQNPAASGRGGGGWGTGGDAPARARSRDDERARQQQKAKAREEAKEREEEARAREERRAKAKEEQKAKQAEPPKQQPATAAPATPAAPAVAAPAQPAPPPPAAATPAAVMPSGLARKSSPAGARVYFVGLQNGAEVSPEVTLRFGVANMGVAPAGLDNPNTGHHHLLIDASLPTLDQPIPSDFNHLHFGAGQTEAVVTLPPGKHKLQLLFADDNHVPHNPAVMSEVIEVIVKAKK